MYTQIAINKIKYLQDFDFDNTFIWYHHCWIFNIYKLAVPLFTFYLQKYRLASIYLENIVKTLINRLLQSLDVRGRQVSRFDGHRSTIFTNSHKNLLGHFYHVAINGIRTVPRGIRYAVVSQATPLNLQIVYVNVYGKVKCPTLGPASPVKSPWYPLVSPGRGIVGHPVDRCI